MISPPRKTPENEKSWRARAACRDMEPGFFFTAGAGIEAAKRFCKACPVQQECLDDALALEEVYTARYGVWGGLGPQDRKRLLRDHG